MAKYIDTSGIRKLLPMEERLCQLAEECAELAQAALKLRRAMDATNPTPVPVGYAYEKLVEETADVLLSLNALCIGTGDEKVLDIQEKKVNRWLDRLENKI